MSVKVRLRKRKSGTAVMLDYEDSNGQRHQRIVGKATAPEALDLVLQDAERQAKRIEFELVEGKHQARMGEESIDAALLEFNEHVQASTAKPGTKGTYRGVSKNFRRFLAGTKAKRLKDVTPRLIVQYIQWQDGKAANSISTYLKLLHRIFARCVNRGVILTNPFSHPDVKDVWPQGTKHERVFTDAELVAFLETARAYDGSVQADDTAGFFLFLAQTGLRVSEGLMLRWCDVSFGEGSYLRVEPHDGWAPKTKSSIRVVPLSPDVEAVLRTLLSACEAVIPTARVFPPNWSPNRVGNDFRRIRRHCGLNERDEKGQRLVMHSLRHYFASNLVRNGADPATVRDLLGHESIVVTNRYFNVPRQELFNTVLSVFSRHKNVTDSSGLYRFPAEKAAMGRNQP